jgi:hypothetical protein
VVSFLGLSPPKIAKVMDSADHDLLLLLPRHVEKLDRLVGPFGESKEVARVETNNEDARSLSRRSR